MSASRYVFKKQTFKRYYGEGDRTGTLELYVDWEKIVKLLGKKAAWNSGKQSSLAIGLKAKFIPDKAPNE